MDYNPVCDLSANALDDAAMMGKNTFRIPGDYLIDNLPLSDEVKAAFRRANMHYVGHIRSSHHLRADNLVGSLPGCTAEMAKEIVAVLPELGW
jgi:hypothetical protein